MRIVRFSAGGNGASQFSDVEVSYPYSRTATGGFDITSSQRLVSEQVQFATLPEGLDQGLHPAPQRQLVVVLTGKLEVGTPDGQTRSFGPGDVFLADDVDTPGHTTRAVDGAVNVLFVPVAEGDAWVPA